MFTREGTFGCHKDCRGVGVELGKSDVLFALRASEEPAYGAKMDLNAPRFETSYKTLCR